MTNHDNTRHALQCALYDAIISAGAFVKIEVLQWMIDVSVVDMFTVLDRLKIHDKYFADGVGGHA